MLARMASLFASFLLALTSVLAQGTDDEVRCDYLRREVCSRDGCKPLPKSEFVSGSYLLVPSLTSLVARGMSGENVDLRQCDAKGCTSFPMHVAGGDGMMNLTDSKLRTASMRIWFGPKPSIQLPEAAKYRQGDFVEMETLLLATVVGYGHCQFPKI